MPVPHPFWFIGTYMLFDHSFKMSSRCLQVLLLLCLLDFVPGHLSRRCCSEFNHWNGKHPFLVVIDSVANMVYSLGSLSFENPFMLRARILFKSLHLDIFPGTVPLLQLLSCHGT